MDSLKEWLEKNKNTHSAAQIYERVQKSLIVDQWARRTKYMKVGFVVFNVGFTIYLTDKFVMPLMRGIVRQIRDFNERK